MGLHKIWVYSHCKNQHLKVRKCQDSGQGCSPDWFDLSLFSRGRSLKAPRCSGGAAGGWLSFWCRSACLFCLFTACHPSPAGNTSACSVSWCSEDARCCSCLPNDGEFVLLLRQEACFPCCGRGERLLPSPAREGAAGAGLERGASWLSVPPIPSDQYQFAGWAASILESSCEHSAVLQNGP